MVRCEVDGVNVSLEQARAPAASCVNHCTVQPSWRRSIDESPRSGRPRGPGAGAPLRRRTASSAWPGSHCLSRLCFIGQRPATLVRSNARLVKRRGFCRGGTTARRPLASARRTGLFDASVSRRNSGRNPRQANLFGIACTFDGVWRGVDFSQSTCAGLWTKPADRVTRIARLPQTPTIHANGPKPPRGQPDLRGPVETSGRNATILS